VPAPVWEYTIGGYQVIKEWLSVVEAIVGHSNPAMTRHYTHVSELAAAHAVNGLPAIMGDPPPALPCPRQSHAMRSCVRSSDA